MERHIDHPQAELEMKHLKETGIIIADELSKLEVELGIRAEEERIVAVRFEGDQAQVVMNTLKMKLQILHQLALSKKQPYFSRIDFVEKGGTEATYYIGRWGVSKTPEFDVVVADWRSPIANLYYSGQVGPMDYETPDGKVTGELNLKRMFTIHDGEMESMFDSGVVSQDAYLQGVLGSVSSDRLKEIVTTIQAEQNYVIRHPLNVPLIVQGVAGSGKTTIALHRIAWLLYAYREVLSPDQMMILAPNPLFLNYISQVLPDLGVENVQQTTFQGLCEKWLKKQMPRMKELNRLEDKLSGTIGSREVLKKKGSLQFKRQLEAYLDTIETTLLPKEDVLFGQATLFTNQELKDIFLGQLKHFPLQVRILELNKYMKNRLKAVARDMEDMLEKMTEERLMQLITRLPEGEERQARVRRLLDSRDLRKQEIVDRAKAYPKAFQALFPDMKVTAVYQGFLETMEGFRDTTALLEKGMAYPEDLPALVVVMKKLYGIAFESIRTIVIDEAQDFSPFQVEVLKEMESKPSFTLVGDLMQGIHEDEGISSWEEIKGQVFGGAVTRHDLVQSYRNTVEIMAFANRVAQKFPVENQRLAKPVLRHGEAVAIHQAQSEKDRLEYVRETVEGWRREGFNTMALIAKTKEEAKAAYKALSKHFPVTLVGQEQTQYQGGVMVIPASLIKGLEFDCVMVLNANEEQYPMEVFMARLLYVMCTRPLHRLHLCYQGRLTPLCKQGPDGV